MKRNKKFMRNAKYSNSSQSNGSTKVSRLAKAMYGLSVLYELGIEGVQKDLAQSMYWLQRAACAGHNVAHWCSFSIYLEDKGYRGSFAAAGIVVLEIALAYLFNRCGFEPAEYHWM